ncbi:DUF4158 domain-containing protein [Streptomyces sp. Go40/10]|nr:DUF4158 domain-containing protein [Streptomyces sp. Go40/10]
MEFLTDEQAAVYGTFGEVPTRPELERFFFLDDDDRDLIALRRSDGHRLGMALQICTVRYIGTFLGDDPLAVPWEVVDYLAGQLGIEDASCVKSYAERRMTPYNHAHEIRERFGYHDYGDRKWSREFRTFLYGRAWTHAEGPVALFNHAVTWLRRHRVLLPGVSVLARQVSEARTVAERRLYESVARATHKADRMLAPALVGLLERPEGKRVSELERLRTLPTKSTGTAMVRAMERVEEISAFALGRVNVPGAGEPVEHAGPVRAAEQGADDSAGAGAAPDGPADGGGTRTDPRIPAAPRPRAGSGRAAAPRLAVRTAAGTAGGGVHGLADVICSAGAAGP